MSRLKCLSALASINSMKKAPGPVWLISQSYVRAVRALEDETPAASTGLVTCCRQNYGDLQRPVDNRKTSHRSDGLKASHHPGPRCPHKPRSPAPSARSQCRSPCDKYAGAPAYSSAGITLQEIRPAAGAGSKAPAIGGPNFPPGTPNGRGPKPITVFARSRVSRPNPMQRPEPELVRVNL
jgi:hypothetical protein